MSDKNEAFNAVAGTYDNWYMHPQGKQVFEAERGAVQHMIPTNGLGLEIGAGTGIFAESLTKFERTILCLDPSTMMLSKTRKRGLMCILGLADPLPIRENVLDFSYMVTVLEFLDSPVDMRARKEIQVPLLLSFLLTRVAAGVSSKGILVLKVILCSSMVNCIAWSRLQGYSMRLITLSLM